MDRPTPRQRTLWAGALLGVLLAVLPASAYAVASDQLGTAARQVPLRVATYNIHAGAGMDNRFDIARQADAIRQLDLDVVGLQEVDVHWGSRSQWRDLATELAEALDMSVFFGHIYDLDPPPGSLLRREYGIAILSRHPVVHAENHWVTRLSTQVPNPSPELAPGFPEVVVNVRGALVHVYATHLDYRADPSVRRLQVADTLRIMAEDRHHQDRPQQVLLGDLNAPPYAPEIQPLWGYVADAWAQANGAAGGLTYPANRPDRRIDYVAVSPGITVRQATVPATLASDHLPVVADLAVTRGA
ncbi:MAG TPA: endonuclease/exonuclease/phosphatase family protein [Micromonosporaceae bacterium]|nr:endonuclease/exonuclease/phosphatase family protein [Micromonosporaceae bacterium]